jgi:hypothetical protein
MRRLYRIVHNHKTLYWYFLKTIYSFLRNNFIILVFLKSHKYCLPTSRRCSIVLVYSTPCRSSASYTYTYDAIAWYKIEKIYDPSTEVQQDYLLAYNNPMLFVFNIHHNQYLICMALDIVNKMHKNYFKILKKAITYFYKLRYFFEKRIFS